MVTVLKKKSLATDGASDLTMCPAVKVRRPTFPVLHVTGEDLVRSVVDGYNAWDPKMKRAGGDCG